LAQLADKVERAVPRPPPDLQVIRLPPAQGDDEHSDLGDMDPDEGWPQGLQDDGSPPVVIKLGPNRSSADVAALYKRARARFQAADFATARQQFEEIARQSPTHELADNAVYWRGVCHYEMGEYLRAIDVLQQLQTRYPRSDKVPDALFKMAEAYRALNDKVSARAYCHQVVERYPRSEAAPPATRLLEAMKADEEGDKH
ncbi:MAG: tol-pal system protein YbgF, partial [Deltaproteobacteria bacterium]|nr:tol-pal system protein YbgF [Deltaproteobacteria bacterium]